MSKADFTFSSSAEVHTYVRAQLGMPTKEQEGMFDPRVANFKGLQSSGYSALALAPGFAFRTMFNPVDYDGRYWREIKNSYKTNELGFFITMAFFLCLGWSFAKYRRNAILEQKKRFVYQQYKRRKFLEESLRLKTREELVQGVEKLEYREYFRK